MKVIYQGAQYCHTSNCCPVATHDPANGTITIEDPAAPEKGRFTMTVDEWNALIAHGRPVSV